MTRGRAVLSAVLLGALMGFVGSVPVAGPISLLVVAHGTRAPRMALGVAAGGAIAESIYAYAAFFGLASLLSRYPGLQAAAGAAGALAMTALGLHFVLRKGGAEGASRAQGGAFARGVALGFGVTIINPSFLATWSAAFTVVVTSGLSPALQPRAALPFSLGAMAGIVAWFALLIALLRRLGSRLSARTLDRLVRVVGAALLLLGAWFAWRAATG